MPLLSERGDVGPVHGNVASGFERVREQFRKNFTDRGERGAACTVYHEGEKVVDLWGGYRDRHGNEPWTEDTLVLVFSATKGMAAAAVALARDRGYFDYDDYVVDHWREFGRYGKQGITVRQLLAHQAGLAGVDEALSPEQVDDREHLMDLLVNRPPDWPPGERHGYHAWTLGWYESELVRRTDPEGRTLAEFFADEIRDPLDLEFHIGTPEGTEDGRIADLSWVHPLRIVEDFGKLPPEFLLAVLNPCSETTAALNPFRMVLPSTVDRPAYRDRVIPATSGVGPVRDLAAVYSDFATGGDRLGVGPETLAELSAEPTPPTKGRRDVVLKTETSYSLGFCRPVPGFDFGSPEAFGHQGAGGSMAFADPTNDLAFAYAPNRMSSLIYDDPRDRALRTAVYDCLEDL